MNLPIVIIGCGNIGSRLLQSLSNISSEKFGTLDIIGVEPFEGARDLARSRFDEENKGGHNLTMLESADDLPNDARLMIFSMDARNRLAAMEQAMSVCRPDNILLEKVLFTRWDEYARAETLISEAGAKCWVNTSRNVWPGYEKLKTELSGAKVTEFSVEGSDWGLGCNAIHFLTAFEFITGDSVTALNMDETSAEIKSSKRSGYQELTGRLNGQSAAGAKISIVSANSEGDPIKVNIVTDREEFAIREHAREYNRSTDADTVHPFDLYYTSQLQGMFETILETGHSGLPVFSESMRLHGLLLSGLNAIFHGEATLEKECPIT